MTPNYFTPEVDVFESKDSVIVYIDLPGVSKNDISIELLGRELILRGIKRSPKYDLVDVVHRIERTYGKLYCEIVLPSPVDEASVNAELHDGVLKIRLKKKNRKKIRVE